ncbi:hypothetical protein GCM10010121_063090 [Streptomyces brasiliensis]|uniref:DUF3073 domain-containing protein n=2 Tax=Streptomyces brasiliensis TaxID=1954 RepID=A0A917L3Y6_9ACTN|nr:hypothetical protein GCM10010121_063090 [Streptomyces brasiliensis]
MGAGSGTVEALRTGLSTESPFQIMNACQDSGAVEPRHRGGRAMGRGRAKAKQTKVARQLKYNSGGTDLSRLANELGASTSSQPPNGEPFEDDEDDDPYARYADLYNDDDEDDEDDESGPASHRRGA